MNDNAQTPLTNPVDCLFCGGAGIMQDMTRWQGIGSSFLHRDCEKVLRKRGAIRDRWITNDSELSIKDMLTVQRRLFANTTHPTATAATP